jgi:hypothetical protein
MAAAAGTQSVEGLQAELERELATQQDTDRQCRRMLRKYLVDRLSYQRDRTEEIRLTWLIFIFEFFKRQELLSIHACIDEITTQRPDLYNSFSEPDHPVEDREREIRESVMKAVGLWLGMPSYFDDTIQSFMPIVLGYRPGHSLALTTNLRDLLSNNRLVPSRSEARTALDDMQSNHPMSSEHIDELLHFLEAPEFGREDLNAYSITFFTNASIYWTENICEHLTVTEKTGKKVLRLFCRPSILLSERPRGTDAKLRNEVVLSYHLLFHAYDGKSNAHSDGYMNSLFRRSYWCGCPACSLARMRAQLLDSLPHGIAAPLDPALRRVINEPSKHENPKWDPTTFEYLWPTVLKLHAFQRDSRPWSFWVAFKDKRDTVRFWTFL